jgi:hypothetical protein
MRRIIVGITVACLDLAGCAVEDEPHADAGVDATGSTGVATGDSDEGDDAAGPSQGASSSDEGGSEGGPADPTMPPPPLPGDESSGTDGGMCLPPTEPCSDPSECCGGRDCDDTSLGVVCCGREGAPCATENGEDCCDNLLCIDGVCGYEVAQACAGPCTAAPGLTLEKQRLDAIGGSFLGICGDANHTYGYHVPAANLPESDYSMEGSANDPVCQYHGAAIDIGMDWPASRDWLEWLIVQIQTDAITGVAEVIGSYDGVNVRYWSDSAGWSTEGIPYTGSGHDTWTHVAVYRSTTNDDHGLLFGWTEDGMQ